MWIDADSEYIQYCGRIDFDDAKAPEFVYPCSSIRIRFTGRKLSAAVSNRHIYWENSLGYIVDGRQGKVVLPETGDRITITLLDETEAKSHDIMLFKRQDACHTFRFYGLETDDDTKLLPPEEPSCRRIEVYGDSVSAGEVSEAVAFAGKEDPEHNGEYSNSYYSYAWICARTLHAQIHDIAQGGAALMNKTGWFREPESIGMEEIFDKIQYYPELGKVKSWDFSKYIPQVVVVAIGQNDSHPRNYMAEDYECEESVCWRKHYKDFVGRLRERYPQATIILTTTILSHHPGWDRSIEEVCRELKMTDSRIHHFMYSRNGCGTPGHIRIPEAEEMSAELVSFIETLGDGIWNGKQ